MLGKAAMRAALADYPAPRMAAAQLFEGWCWRHGLLQMSLDLCLFYST